MEKPLVLENSLVRMELDGRNGSIRSLRRKNPDVEYVSVPSMAGLFSISAPPLYFRSGEQVVTRNRMSRPRRGGQALTLQFSRMTEEKSRRSLPVDMAVRFQLADDSDRIRCAFVIRNSCRQVLRIESVDFPVVSGIRPGGRKLALPVREGHRVENLEDVLRRFRYYIVDYPCYGSMRWMDLYGTDSGLYLGCHDENPGITRMCLEWDEEPVSGGEGMSFYFTRYPWIAFGETWRSPEYLLVPHAGDWHAGADIYREWAGPRYLPPDTPDRVRRQPGWFAFCMMNNTPGNLSMNMTNKELCAVYSAVRNLGCENLWLYNHAGQILLQENTVNLTQHDQGLEEFRRVVKKLAAKGANIVACVSYRLMPSDGTYLKEAIHDEKGNPCREQWYGCVSHIMCPASKRWLAEMQNVVRENVGTYGLSGLYIDQSAAQVPQICLNPAHRHRNPAEEWGQNDIRFLQGMREAAVRENPEAVFTGECVVDAYAPVLDVNLCMSDPDAPVGRDFINEWQSRIGVSEPAIYRYTFPRHILCGGAVDFLNDLNWRNRVNACFQHGMQFFFWCLKPIRATAMVNLPEDTAAYLRFYSRMWKASYVFFTEGEYLDTLGLSVSPESVRGTLFRKDGSILVALRNIGKDPCTAQVRVRSREAMPDFRGIASVTDLSRGEALKAGSAGWTGEVLEREGISVELPGESIGAILLEPAAASHGSAG